MGVVSVVYPPDGTDWHVDPASFGEALAARWPQADVDVPAGTVPTTRSVT